MDPCSPASRNPRSHPARWRVPGASSVFVLSLLMLLGPSAARAQEDPADQHPTRPGAWQGEWTLTREHPGLRTLAGSRLFELAVHHAEGGTEATVWWLTGPAICPDPLADEPCEWIGATGGPLTVPLVEGRLVAVLPVSADADDPFVLVLDAPSPPGASRGALVSARGGVAWAVDARRDR